MKHWEDLVNKEINQVYQFFRSQSTNTTTHTTPTEVEEVAVEHNVFEDPPQNLPNYDAEPVDLDEIHSTRGKDR